MEWSPDIIRDFKSAHDPTRTCVAQGDQKGAQACRAALQQVPVPETPDIRLIFNPEGLSNAKLEKLAEGATPSALEKLRQALDAHEKRLVEAQQTKTGRNALVSAQKKRIALLQKLVADGEWRPMAKKEEKDAVHPR